MQLPATAKIGSRENQYYTLAFIGMFIGVFLFIKQVLIHPDLRPRLFFPWIIAWTTQTVIILAILLQPKGIIPDSIDFRVSLLDSHIRNTMVQDCLRTVPKPAYVPNLYGALPWINPSSQNFVVAFGYPFDKSRGIDFESGGIEGLFQQGYFESIVIPDDSKMELNPTRWKLREENSECAKLQVYLKK